MKSPQWRLTTAQVYFRLINVEMKRSPCYQGSRTKDTNLFDLFPCLEIKTESGLNAQIVAAHKEMELKDNPNKKKRG